MTEINKASQQSLQRILDKIGVKKAPLTKEDFMKIGLISLFL